MKCINCNAEIPDNSLKCSLCGQVYDHKDNVCPNCYAVIKPGAEKCSVCGYNIAKSKSQEKIKKVANMIKIIYEIITLVIILCLVILCMI